jgi:hypothetical protein
MRLSSTKRDRSHEVTEASFKIKVRAKLDRLGDDCYYFVKEAKTLRGIADIIGCYKGVPFFWELKRSERELHHWRDGHELQKYNLERANAAGGMGWFVYPENLEEALAELLRRAESRAA